MKRSLIGIVGIALCVSLGSAVYAQSGDGAASRSPAEQSAALGRAGYGIVEARRDFKLLALSDAEAARIRVVLDKGLRDVERARAEIRELQARLARQMLEDKPDMDAMRATVRSSLDAELVVRMTQIERNLAIRDILGDRRWAALTRLSRAFVALSREGNLRVLAERAGDVESLSLLFDILKTLQ